MAEESAVMASPPHFSESSSVDSLCEEACGEANVHDDDDGGGSVVLRPQSRDRRRTAVATDLTPGTVSSPPEWVLPASTSEVGSPLVPLPRTDRSVAVATAALVDSGEGEAVKGAHDIRQEEPLPLEKEEDKAVPVPVRDEDTTSDMRRDGEQYAMQTPLPSRRSCTRLSPPTRGQAQESVARALVGEEEHGSSGDDEEENTGLISLRASPVAGSSGHTSAHAAASITATPLPADITTAIHRGNSASFHSPLFAAHDGQDHHRGGDSSTPVVSAAPALPLADRDGLVFSPPRQRQMQLRLQRRRRREPSEGSISSAGVSPRSPAPQPFLCFSRSASATPAPVFNEDACKASVEVEKTDERPVCTEATEERYPAEALAQDGVLPQEEIESHATSPEAPLLLPLRHPPPPAPGTAALTAAQPTEPLSAVAAMEATRASTHAAGMQQHDCSPAAPQVEAVTATPLPSSTSQQGTPSHADVVSGQGVPLTGYVRAEEGEEDVRVADNNEDAQDENERTVAAEQPPISATPLSPELRSPPQRSAGNSSGTTGMSSTPVDVRYTAAAVPAAHITAKTGEDDARTPMSDRSGSARPTEASPHTPIPSVSPAPRRTSSPHGTSPPPDVHARRSISTMDFTWAAAAEAALLRQQQRVYAHSLAQGGRSPSLQCSRGDGPPTESGGLATGPQVYHPLPEGAIGLRPPSVRAAVSETPAWSVSPQPQEPQVRFCPMVSAPPLNGRNAAAPDGVTFEPFASPTRVVSSSPHAPPQQRGLSSYSTSSPPVAGGKRARSHPINTDVHENDTQLHCSFASTADASASPLPRHQLPVERGEADVPRVRRTRRERRADRANTASHYPSHSTNNGNGSGSAATIRRKPAHRSTLFATSAAATAASAVNEFVLPRTVSAEPAPTASAARAPSPLQPRSVNHPRHPPGKPSSVAASAAGKRKAKKTSAMDEKGSVSSGQGDRSAKRAATHRKPSMVVLNHKLQQRKQPGSEN
ncbi:hypothetical protein ABB37_08431 [Leptomonas pyrrhocoris]|uniref:Uncharacterized protein n=1 Tax=Leptomonas pyrrhocoris TaxID=157538 RepID=A0A0N0DS67_LEPPY|nr:hypothetical protein ABB37_08431 [Leptomonas pyrrhocoris]KPA75541.1 hypothetical protein ABB37_08431 [Leptomonas pyrrhocoris]|eukprot:XP_015653980.1 hypothetical protein ABB37_08431 [Leptomonas pyrrhocoris]